MSEVTLIVVSNNDIHSLTAHWRQIKALMSKSLPECSEEADYIILDLNKKIIVNNQQAFAVDLKGFEVIEL